ncbi:MAG: Secretion system C-terminal sorting domain, partial [Bacteroidota bacterium]
VHLQYATLQENALLQLIDINGKVVQQQWLPAWSQMQNIKLNNLSSGIYLLKISNTSYKGTAKVIVQNE